MIAQPSTPRPVVSMVARPIVIPVTPRFFNPGELEILADLVASVAPRTVIEFGVNEGCAAAALLAHVPEISSYIGIDVLPGYITQCECQRAEVPQEPGKFVRDEARFRLILKPRGSFDLGAGDLPACDAVFIDADHSRLGVMNDYALARRCVRPGGIIIFHDDNGLSLVQVSETLDELAGAGAQIEHVAGTWLAFERV